MWTDVIILTLVEAWTGLGLLSPSSPHAPGPCGRGKGEKKRGDGMHGWERKGPRGLCTYHGGPTTHAAAHLCACGGGGEEGEACVFESIKSRVGGGGGWRQAHKEERAAQNPPARSRTGSCRPLCTGSSRADIGLDKGGTSMGGSKSVRSKFFRVLLLVRGSTTNLLVRNGPFPFGTGTQGKGKERKQHRGHTTTTTTRVHAL